MDKHIIEEAFMCAKMLEKTKRDQLTTSSLGHASTLGLFAYTIKGIIECIGDVKGMTQINASILNAGDVESELSKSKPKSAESLKNGTKEHLVYAMVYVYKDEDLAKEPLIKLQKNVEREVRFFDTNLILALMEIVNKLVGEWNKIYDKKTEGEKISEEEAKKLAFLVETHTITGINFEELGFNLKIALEKNTEKKVDKKDVYMSIGTVMNFLIAYFALKHNRLDLEELKKMLKKVEKKMLKKKKPPMLKKKKS